MNNTKCILLLSGGLDSTCLLHFIKKELNLDVYGISFQYGQRHNKELSFAEYWGEKLCVEHKIIDISFMKDMAGKNALMDSNIDLPQEHYTHENQKVTVVPNRNMIMLSIAIAWAENLSINRVFYAPHANDKAIYPDCRPEFVDAIRKASICGTYASVKIITPFIEKTKADIVSIGSSLGVDFTKTWTCYKGKEFHCGKCATCQERIEAFQVSKIKDFTLYK